jgi:hypothetical protein
MTTLAEHILWLFSIGAAALLLGFFLIATVAIGTLPSHRFRKQPMNNFKAYLDRSLRTFHCLIIIKRKRFWIFDETEVVWHTLSAPDKNEVVSILAPEYEKEARKNQLSEVVVFSTALELDQYCERKGILIPKKLEI